ncbi:MAG: TAXI family TRAP transporter solute-binding subunit [Proteobacteria bacterium]|nr:MAG: TAXI family TRAP transporter solute-binding subunit [Pseudomonadota bacterium]TDJ68998.1 MAG: TAXI family TRAP transporter solute-binding subunit [Pseudomonadota bacterium]
MIFKKLFVALAAAFGLSLVAVNAGAVEFVTIGTGGVTGVYYPTGGAICRLVNKRKKEHGIRCSVESTGGSVYNLNTIRAGELDMGIVQSDWQYHAYNGTGKDSFKKAGPHKELRAVFSVHAEPVSLIARKDSGIRHVKDLVGKRVNIGNPGSGTEATWTVMWKAMGHTNADLKLAAQLKSAETPQALCDNKIDAFFWLVGNPAALNKEATTTCDAVFAEVSGPAIDKLVKDNAFYRYATIPGGMYRGNPNDIKTYGVGATFVASTKTSEKAIYEVVKAVFDNFDAFKKFHPAFSGLKESEMIKDALSAPLHAGAIKYYKERGWQ